MKNPHSSVEAFWNLCLEKQRQGQLTDADRKALKLLMDLNY